jgi:Tol biopolymer transport system component
VQLTQTAAAVACDHSASRFNDWTRAFSPTGLWGAVICENDFRTIVYRLDGSRLWRLPPYRLGTIPPSSADMLLPLHWSVDGKYLYLTVISCCQPQVAAEFEDGAALLRFDLDNGTLVPVLDPFPQGDGYALSFSPGDRTLAYVPPGAITLVHLVDLATGEDDVLHLKEQYWDAGRFSWSPDGKQVVFTAGLPNWVTGEGGFSLLLYDLPNHKLRVVHPDDPNQLATAGPTWLSDREVLLRSVVTGQYMKLDVATGEVVPISAP